MQKLLLTYEGRIPRSKIFVALFYYIVVSLAVSVAMWALWQVIPGTVDETGTFHVDGLAAVPYVVLGLGTLVFFVWSGICVGIKRFHDRNKSGWWILIQLVPLIGPIWYFVDVFCLRGTVGDNRFGPDPLAG